MKPIPGSQRAKEVCTEATEENAATKPSNQSRDPVNLANNQASFLRQFLKTNKTRPDPFGTPTPTMFNEEAKRYNARQKATVCFSIFPRYSGSRGEEGIPSSIIMLWVSSDGEIGGANLPHEPGQN